MGDVTAPPGGPGEGASKVQDEEWEVARVHLGLPPSGLGPQIPRIMHRFWTGGPLREGAFRFLMDSARAVSHGWSLVLWRSRHIEHSWEEGAEERRGAAPEGSRGALATGSRGGSWPVLGPGDIAAREAQREALAAAGYALRSIEELLSPACEMPLSETLVRQVEAAARVAAEHPDAGEERVNVKCFSDVARLVYLRAMGGLHLDVDIGLGDMDLASGLRHHDPRGQVPLFGALGRDTESAPEVAESLQAAREARRRGLLDRASVKHLAERAVLGARAYNAVIATRPGTEHLDLALRALLAEAAKSERDLPSGMSVQRVLLRGRSELAARPSELAARRSELAARSSEMAGVRRGESAQEAEAALEAAVRLSVPPYFTRLDQLTSESDRAPVVPEVKDP